MEKRPLQEEPVSSLALWRFRLEGLLLGGKAKMDPGGGAVHPETKWGSESLWARKSSRDLLGSDLVSQLSKLCEPPSPAPAHSWHRGPPAHQKLLGSYSENPGVRDTTLPTAKPSPGFMRRSSYNPQLTSVVMNCIC